MVAAKAIKDRKMTQEPESRGSTGEAIRIRPGVVIKKNVAAPASRGT